MVMVVSGVICEAKANPSAVTLSRAGTDQAMGWISFGRAKKTTAPKAQLAIGAADILFYRQEPMGLMPPC